MHDDYRSLVAPIVDCVFRLTYAWIAFPAVLLWGLLGPLLQPLGICADFEATVTPASVLEHLTTPDPPLSGCALVGGSLTALAHAALGALRLAAITLGLAALAGSLYGLRLLAQGREGRSAEQQVWHALGTLLSYGFFLVFRVIGAALLVALLPVLAVSLPAAHFYGLIDATARKDLQRLPVDLRRYLTFDDAEIDDFHAPQVAALLLALSLVGLACWVAVLGAPLMFAVCLCTGYYGYRAVALSKSARDWVFWSWVLAAVVATDALVAAVVLALAPLCLVLRPLLGWVGLAERLEADTAARAEAPRLAARVGAKLRGGDRPGVLRRLLATGFALAEDDKDPVADALGRALDAQLATARLGLYWLARLVVALAEAALPLASLYRAGPLLRAAPQGFQAFERAAFDECVSLLLDVFSVPATLLIVATGYKLPMLARFRALWASTHTRRRDLVRDRLRFAKAAIQIAVSVLFDLCVSGPWALVAVVLAPCSTYLIGYFGVGPKAEDFLLFPSAAAPGVAAGAGAGPGVAAGPGAGPGVAAGSPAPRADGPTTLLHALRATLAELLKIGDDGTERADALNEWFSVRCAMWSARLLWMTATYAALGALGLVFLALQLLRLAAAAASAVLVTLSLYRLSTARAQSGERQSAWAKRDVWTRHLAGLVCDAVAAPALAVAAVCHVRKAQRLWRWRGARLLTLSADVGFALAALASAALAALDLALAFAPTLALLATPWWWVWFVRAHVLAAPPVVPETTPETTPTPKPSTATPLRASAEESYRLVSAALRALAKPVAFDLVMLLCAAVCAASLWQLPALVRDVRAVPAPRSAAAIRAAMLARARYAVHPSHLLTVGAAVVLLATLWQLPRTARELTRATAGETLRRRAAYAVHPYNVTAWLMILVVSLSGVRGAQLWGTLLRSEDRFRALVARRRLKACRRLLLRRERAMRRHNKHLTLAAQNRFTAADMQATVAVLRTRFMRKSFEFLRDSHEHAAYWGLSAAAADHVRSVLVAETQLQASHVLRAQLLAQHSRGEISASLYGEAALAYDARSEAVQGEMVAAREALRTEELGAKKFLRDLSYRSRRRRSNAGLYASGGSSPGGSAATTPLEAAAGAGASREGAGAGAVQVPRPEGASGKSKSAKRQQILSKRDWLSQHDNFGPFRAAQFHLQELSLDVFACLAFAVVAATLYRLPAMLTEVVRNTGALDRRRACLEHLRLLAWDAVYLLQALVVVGSLYRVVDLCVDLAAVVTERRGADAARVAVERNFWLLYDMVRTYWLDFTRNWRGVFRLYRLAWTLLGLTIVAPAEALSAVLSPLVPNRTARGCLATLHVAVGFAFPLVFALELADGLDAEQQMLPVALFLGWQGLFVLLGAKFTMSSASDADAAGAPEKAGGATEEKAVPWVSSSGNIALMATVLLDAAQVLSLMLLANEHVPISLLNLVGEELGEQAREWLVEHNVLFLDLPAVPEHAQFWATMALTGLWLLVVTLPPAIEDSLQWRAKGYITATGGYRLALLALSDAALMLIATSCCEMISCKVDSAADQLVLREDDGVVCFQGAHRWQAPAVLMALFFYTTTATAASAVTSPPIIDSALMPDISFHRRFTGAVNLVKLFEAAIEAFASDHAGWMCGSFFALNAGLAWYSWRGFRQLTGARTCTNPVVGALRTWSHLLLVIASAAGYASVVVAREEDAALVALAMLAGWALLSTLTLLYVCRMPRVPVLDPAAARGPESDVHVVAVRRSLDVDAIVHSGHVALADAQPSASPTRALPQLAATLSAAGLCARWFQHSKDVVRWMAVVAPVPAAGARFSWELRPEDVRVPVRATACVWVRGTCEDTDSAAVDSGARRPVTVGVDLPPRLQGATALLVVEVEARVVIDRHTVPQESKILLVPQPVGPARSSAPSPVPSSGESDSGEEETKEEVKEEEVEVEVDEEPEEEPEEAPEEQKDLHASIIRAQPVESLAFSPNVIGGMFEGRFSGGRPCVRFNPATVDFKHVHAAAMDGAAAVLELAVPDAPGRTVRLPTPHAAFAAEGGLLISKMPVDERERVICYAVRTGAAAGLMAD